MTMDMISSEIMEAYLRFEEACKKEGLPPVKMFNKCFDANKEVTMVEGDQLFRIRAQECIAYYMGLYPKPINTKMIHMEEACLEVFCYFHDTGDDRLTKLMQVANQRLNGQLKLKDWYVKASVIRFYYLCAYCNHGNMRILKENETFYLDGSWVSYVRYLVKEIVKAIENNNWKSIGAGH